MIYLEHPPHPGLAQYVECYWTEPGSPASRVIGTMTRPLAFRDAGTLDLLGVRFRAGGATPFLRFPASEVTDGTLSLSDLWGADAEDLAGRRQLERRFLAIVGIPPKTACRVLRFRAALTKLRTAGRLSLSRVAMECGYHDQAHFTRDFRAFAGVTPGVYRRTHDDAFLRDRGKDAS